MKMTAYLCLLALLSFGPLVHAQTAPSDQKIEQDTQQLKKDYQQKTDQELKAIGAKIKKLKHRADYKLNNDLKKETKDLEAQKKAGSFLQP